MDEGNLSWGSVDYFSLTHMGDSFSFLHGHHHIPLTQLSPHSQQEFNPDVKLQGVWQAKDLLEIHREAASKTTFIQHLPACSTGSHCSGKICDKWLCPFLPAAMGRVYLAASWPWLVKGSYQWPPGMLRQFSDFVFVVVSPLWCPQKQKKVALMGSDNSQLRPFL